MKITTYTGGFAQTNGYLVQTDEGCVVIDAPEGIWDFCQQEEIKPTGLLLTHQHFDHVDDASKFETEGEVPIYAAEPFSRDLTIEETARRWGLPCEITPFTVTHILKPDSPLRLIGLEFVPHSLPGHSLDSFVFHVALFQKLFAGDTLFESGIGRTDLPGGNHELLLEGIRKVLFTKPENTEILPGHGSTTTICQEMRSNPYL